MYPIHETITPMSNIQPSPAQPTTVLEYKDQWSSYRLNRLADGSHAIFSPDGEGGWYLVEDDVPTDISGFESRCDLLSEELRILMAEARAEFGF